MGFIGKYAKCTPQIFEPGTSPKIASNHNGLSRVATKISPKFVQTQPRSWLYARRARAASVKNDDFCQKNDEKWKTFCTPPKPYLFIHETKYYPRASRGGTKKVGQRVSQKSFIYTSI